MRGEGDVSGEVVGAWDFPEELRLLQDGPHTIRRRTSEEEALAAISSELQRQHDAVQAVLSLPVVSFALQEKGRLASLARGEFDWSQVREGRQFWRLADFGTSRIKYTIRRVEPEGAAPPLRINAWATWGSVNSELICDAETFVASFGGWVDEEDA